MTDTNQMNSFRDAALVLTSVFVSIFLIISFLWICKYYFCPSTFTDPMMLSSTARSSGYNNNNNNATIFHSTHGVTSSNHSEHPIVPFSTKVRSIFLESVLQHETFHPHKSCTTTTDDIEKGKHTTSMTTVAIGTPIEENGQPVDKVECNTETEVLRPTADSPRIRTECIQVDDINVCTVSAVQSRDDGSSETDQNIVLTDDSNSTDNMNDSCAICYETLEDGDEITTSNCSKTFHRTCIITWLMQHDTCPYCRNAFKNINDNKNIDAILVNDIFDCE